MLSLRLLLPPEGVVQIPSDCQWPRHTAFLLPVAPPDGPWLPAGAPHAATAATVPGPAAGVRFPHPQRYSPHRIVSLFHGYNHWLWHISSILPLCVTMVHWYPPLKKCQLFYLFSQFWWLQSTGACGQCPVFRWVDDGGLEPGTLHQQSPRLFVRKGLEPQR